MPFNFYIWIGEHLPRADQSAMCAINRHLQCMEEKRVSRLMSFFMSLSPGLSFDYGLYLMLK